MNVTRLPDGTSPRNPGEIAWFPYAAWGQRPQWLLGDGEWHLRDPLGGVCALGRTTRDTPAAHTVVVNDDGSLTVTPSIVAPSGWHGFLTRGELA